MPAKKDTTVQVATVHNLSLVGSTESALRLHQSHPRCMRVGDRLLGGVVREGGGAPSTGTLHSNKSYADGQQ